MPRPTVAEKRQRFRQLHQSGCFIIPNPWDVGSACFLQHLGFEALATTSAGFAFAQGRPDNGVSLEMALAHYREIVAVTDIPVNADFEGGHAVEPEKVAENVRLCVETGVAGLSIEDSTGDPEKPLFEVSFAAERVAAARAAIDAALPGKGGVLLTGRAENFFAGVRDLDDAIARLKAYSEAGADCLYAPGIRTEQQIRAVVQAVAPKPVNLLIGSASPITLDAARALGVRRVSVGSGLAHVAWAAFVEAAKAMKDEGSFGGLLAARPPVDLNALFREDLGRRAE